MKTNWRSSSTFPKDRYVLWITTKFCDIRLYPFKSKNLIFKSGISGSVRMTNPQEAWGDFYKS